jgi:hypothetical protein
MRLGDTMVRLLASTVLLLSAAPLAAQPTPASISVNPRALELFDRDWVLMDWALRAFDTNRDVVLSPAEASAAAQAFKHMADADRDGQVTPREYAAAREFILARY